MNDETEKEITNHVVANSNKPIKMIIVGRSFGRDFLQNFSNYLDFLLHILKLFCIQCNWDFACHAAAAAIKKTCEQHFFNRHEKEVLR